MTLASRIDMEFASLEMQLKETRAEVERLRSLLFRLRNYIAGEHTSDRPKDAMLELIDAALEHKP